ncbi:type IV pilus biogenesis/stability protein PilW [[Pseudomonas] boreopolis]|uniref:Type IV pilus biogenesis/stability protein PilW n=1 Tax=Xanthomonas boreopolis TaxID=86183 RepID=A0A919F4W9_9XANT|nr:type IV pilus biogenesis/stability protein PilW [[Pseudomonas] boreopolis]
MPRRDVALALILLAAALCAGCGTASRNGKPGKVRNVEQVAPRYDLRDSAETRNRIALQERLGLAVNRLQTGEYDDAERLARDVLKRDPKSVDAYTVLAVVASQRGDGQAAGDYYRKTTELAPGQGDVLNNYGAWLCANGYPAEALVWFDRAMSDPRYGSPASALANAGGCALQAGQNERALRDLRRALELDPANAYALESMARNEYAHGRYFEARAFSERRLAAAPATVSVLQLAIQIEMGLGDKVAAGRYQQRLGKEFPETAAAHPGG